MSDRDILLNELAEIMFEANASKMDYLRLEVSKLSNEELLELLRRVDSIFQQYSEGN